MSALYKDNADILKGFRLYAYEDTTADGMLALIMPACMAALSYVCLEMQKGVTKDAEKSNEQLSQLKRKFALDVSSDAAISCLNANNVNKARLLFADFKFRYDMLSFFELVCYVVIVSASDSLMGVPFELALTICAFCYVIKKGPKFRQLTHQFWIPMNTILLLELLTVYTSQMPLVGPYLIFSFPVRTGWFDRSYSCTVVKLIGMNLLLVCFCIRRSFPLSQAAEKVAKLKTRKIGSESEKKGSLLFRMLRPVSQFCFCVVAMLFVVSHPSAVLLITLPPTLYGFYSHSPGYARTIPFVTGVLILYMLAQYVYNMWFTAFDSFYFPLFGLYHYDTIAQGIPGFYSDPLYILFLALFARYTIKSIAINQRAARLATAAHQDNEGLTNLDGRGTLEINPDSELQPQNIAFNQWGEAEVSSPRSKKRAAKKCWARAKVKMYQLWTYIYQGILSWLLAYSPNLSMLLLVGLLQIDYTVISFINWLVVLPLAYMSYVKRVRNWWILLAGASFLLMAKYCFMVFYPHIPAKYIGPVVYIKEDPFAGKTLNLLIIFISALQYRLTETPSFKAYLVAYQAFCKEECREEGAISPRKSARKNQPLNTGEEEKDDDELGEHDQLVNKNLSLQNQEKFDVLLENGHTPDHSKDEDDAVFIPPHRLPDTLWLFVVKFGPWLTMIIFLAYIILSDYSFANFFIMIFLSVIMLQMIFAEHYLNSFASVSNIFSLYIVLLLALCYMHHLSHVLAFGYVQEYKHVMSLLIGREENVESRLVLLVLAVFVLEVTVQLPDIPNFEVHLVLEKHYVDRHYLKKRNCQYVLHWTKVIVAQFMHRASPMCLVMLCIFIALYLQSLAGFAFVVLSVFMLLLPEQVIHKHSYLPISLFTILLFNFEYTLKIFAQAGYWIGKDDWEFLFNKHDETDIDLTILILLALACVSTYMSKTLDAYTKSNLEVKPVSDEQLQMLPKLGGINDNSLPRQSAAIADRGDGTPRETVGVPKITEEQKGEDADDPDESKEWKGSQQSDNGKKKKKNDDDNVDKQEKPVDPLVLFIEPI